VRRVERLLLADFCLSRRAEIDPLQSMTSVKLRGAASPSLRSEANGFNHY